MQKMHHDKRADDRGGDRQQNVDRGAPGAQKDPAHQRRDDRREDQRKCQFADGFFNKLR